VVMGAGYHRSPADKRFFARQGNINQVPKVKILYSMGGGGERAPGPPGYQGKVVLYFFGLK